MRLFKCTGEDVLEQSSLARCYNTSLAFCDNSCTSWRRRNCGDAGFKLRRYTLLVLLNKYCEFCVSERGVDSAPVLRSKSVYIPNSLIAIVVEAALACSSGRKVVLDYSSYGESLISAPYVLTQREYSVLLLYN
jgi:hypothetical protein